VHCAHYTFADNFISDIHQSGKTVELIVFKWSTGAILKIACMTRVCIYYRTTATPKNTEMRERPFEGAWSSKNTAHRCEKRNGNV